MRKRAQEAGHLKVLANTEVLDIETVETSHGQAISAVVTAYAVLRNLDIIRIILIYIKDTLLRK